MEVDAAINHLEVRSRSDERSSGAIRQVCDRLPYCQPAGQNERVDRGATVPTRPARPTLGPVAGDVRRDRGMVIRVIARRTSPSSVGSEELSSSRELVEQLGQVNTGEYLAQAVLGRRRAGHT